jgi:antitoxin component YwqK of YwqJK toxin-antitoxin module
MNKLILAFLLLSCINSPAQYYYKDIIGTAELNRQMQTYTANNIQKITATGIKPEGGVAPDFSELQEVNTKTGSLKITTRRNNYVSILHHTFNEKGQVIKSVDSAFNVKSISVYTYDASGNITSINNSATDADSTADFTQTEVHQFFYKDGKLEKMWRIINKNDSLEVKFAIDESGNVIEERNYKKGIAADPIYYYYDDRNRLTDIVRFNYKANRLLPDFLFEYDEQDRVIQKITPVSNQNRGYLLWRYLFNEKGLKTKEALFDKEKQLQGRIDYSYN